MEKIVLTNKSYNTIKSMLESSDEDDKVVGFQCLENMDLKSNLTYVLFLYKESNVTVNDWLKHAPKTSELLSSIHKVGLASISTSFKNVAMKMKDYEASQEQYQFFADKYSEHLIEYLDNPTVMSVKIEIKTSYNESRTTSKDL